MPGFVIVLVISGLELCENETVAALHYAHLILRIVTLEQLPMFKPWYNPKVESLLFW